MHACRGVRLLVILAPWFWLASCRQAPAIRTTPSQTTQRPTTESATRSIDETHTSIPAWKFGFTHYVTAETALLRRGDPNGDVIYDTISAGSRVRMVGHPHADDVFIHVTSEDGRDGLIGAVRLKLLIRPVTAPEPVALMTSPLHPPFAATQLTRPNYSPRARTRSVADVNAAVEKAAQYLESLQGSDGGWESAFEMGTRRYSALIAGTLFAAEGMEFKGLDRAKAMLWDYPESEVATLMFRDEIFDRRHDSSARSGAATLLNIVSARRPELADTFFGRSIGSDAEDPVNSYYALRAICSSDQNGIELPPAFLKRSDAQWREKQRKDGGWSSGKFSEQAPSDFLGTAAGFLALSITGERSLDVQSNQFCQHTGNYVDANLQAAAGWLNQHMPDVLDDIRRGNSERPCQTLWWLDQVMTEAGAIRIDRRDSSTQMLQWLLEEQMPDGRWVGKLSETAFAVRILLNHLRPPGIAKLAYEPGAWNQRPDEIRHASRWLGQHLFNTAATRWLIVDIDDPEEDFNALPILYIAGDSDFQVNVRQQDKLRRFVEQGGLIVGNADLGGAEFDKAFKSLGLTLFPQYEFRSLPKTHPIFGHQQPMEKQLKNAITLMGLSNGVRELMLLIPEADPSLNWQNEQTKTRAEAFDVLGNIMLYAVGHGAVKFSREFPTPLQPTKVLHKWLTVAQLHVGDNWNPEPGAWPRIDDIMQTQDGLRLNIHESQLEPRSLSNCQFAHLTGTTRFVLSPGQRQELHDFVADGGTLLIDAAGGSADFADSAQSELQAMFGDDGHQIATPLQPAILYAKPNGLAPPDGQPQLYRRQVRLHSGDSDRTPRIRVISLGNRMAVFFSREDLVSAMAGIESDDILGYRPQAGVDLVRSILLYADKNL